MDAKFHSVILTSLGSILNLLAAWPGLLLYSRLIEYLKLAEVNLILHENHRSSNALNARRHQQNFLMKVIEKLGINGIFQAVFLGRIRLYRGITQTLSIYESILL